jgi:hypothetical protein
MNITSAKIGSNEAYHPPPQHQQVFITGDRRSAFPFLAWVGRWSYLGKRSPSGDWVIWSATYRPNRNSKFLRTISLSPSRME